MSCAAATQGGPGDATLTDVRFAAFAAASLALHVAVVAGVVVRRARSAEVPPPGAPTLAGDTFEVNDPGDGEETYEIDPAPTPAPTPSPTPEPGTEPGRAPRPTSPPSRKARPAAHAATSPGVPSPPVTTFGAVGERSAVDLPTAFTRAFPQAASADPAWMRVALGAAGDADLTLTLDESGKLVGTTISPGTPPALRTGIARTVALIRGRAFTAAGARTKLHVTAVVSADQVHDGLHGDVFALGGSFAGGQGNAFFALAIGRRIDLRITGR